MNRVAQLLALVLAFGGLYFWGRNAAKPAGTPSGQIRAALTTALDEFNSGNLAGAMRVISHDYKDSTGNNRDRLYILGRRGLSADERGTVTLQRLIPDIDNDTAVVHVVAKVDWPGVPLRDYNVELTMKREPARAFLFFPTTRWRVVYADGLLEPWGGEGLL
jgi:hypothetical protein